MQPEPLLPRKHRPDLLLVLFITVLILLGLIVIFAISPALAIRINAGGFNLDQNHFMYRQLLYILVAASAFVAMFLVPLKAIQKHKGKFLVVSIIISLLPIILASTPLALCANGACRWLDLGLLSFQPAELVKFALVLFLASFMALRIREGNLNDVGRSLVPIAAVVLVIAFIVVGLQKDLGTGLAIFAIVMSMLFVAGLKAKYFGMVIVASLTLVIAFIVIAPHRLERVMTFISHSESTEEGMGYHINQALIAVGSGGLTGKGLGQSVQAFGYLPEAANDSIFAILAEKFGFFGTTAVLMIFGALFMRVLKIMRSISDTNLKLIVAGVFGWIFSHTIVNIGSMLGVFPLTGVTLPFVSFGGTSLLLMMAALGLVFHISRYTTHQLESSKQEGAITSYDNSFGRGRVRRARHTSAGSAR